MLKDRIITALLGLPIVLGLIIFGGELVFATMITGCVAFSVYELVKMLLPILQTRLVIDSPVFDRGRLWPLTAAMLGIVGFLTATQGGDITTRGGIAFVMVAAMFLTVFTSQSIEVGMSRLIAVLVALCYGFIPWLAVWELYLIHERAGYILLLLAAVMGGDSGAYFAGRSFGKTPLAPKLSPKKTWEGLLGGLISAVIAVQLVNMVYLFKLGSFWNLVGLALVGSIGGALGDLVESAFKRFCGIKDSGAVFPGHGGFLDRADALIGASACVWVWTFVFMK